MSKYKIPISNPKPDIKSFLNYITGKKKQGKPPIFEYIMDDYAIKKPVIKDMLGRRWVDTSVLGKPLDGQINLSKENIENVKAWLDNEIAFWYHMGYDFIVETMISLAFPAGVRIAKDTASSTSNRDRIWEETSVGPISSWEDYEKYPWPKVEDSFFFPWEYISNNLPEGMGLIAAHGGGLLEHLTRLFGYEGLCFNLMDNYDLVKKVTNKIGSILAKFYKKLLKIDKIVALFPGDDMGYNIGTLISPEHIRKLILPWHKRYAKMAYDKGILYFIHTCGNIEKIMDDLIVYVKIDGKHSFQDGTSPVIEAKELYGDRIALLGGVDIDKLSRFDEEKLRSYVRNIISKCSRGGRFAIGSGNSIPSYVTLENYFIMIDEAIK